MKVSSMAACKSVQKLPEIIVVEMESDENRPIPKLTTPQHQIMDPDHYVIALKYEKSDNFVELIMGHLTRFLDLPGDQLETLLSSLSSNSSANKSQGSIKLLKKSWGFNRKKEVKSGIFGQRVTDESLSQIKQLMDFLNKHLEVEGLFRKPGNSNRMQKLQAAMETGVCIDLENSKFLAHDVASVLKTYIGDLPEALLQDRYFNCHLQIADMMALDSKGNKTNMCNKSKRIEALQLLLLLLPTENRTLLRGILNLLYKTAKQHAKNKMNASNLSKMFAPNLLWPRNLKATQLQGNITKLNDHVAFMIKHSEKIMIAPQYIRDEAKRLYLYEKSGTPSPPATYSVIATPSGAVKRTVSGRMDYNETTRSNTETALKELFDHVQNMPQSAKKKKMVKNLEKHTKATTPKPRRHNRSRTFGGMIKKRVLSVAKSNSGGASSSNQASESEGKKKETSDETSFVHIPQPGSATMVKEPLIRKHRWRSTGKSKKEKNAEEISICSERSYANKSTDELLPIPFPSHEVLETEID